MLIYEGDDNLSRLDSQQPSNLRARALFRQGWCEQNVEAAVTDDQSILQQTPGANTASLPLPHLDLQDPNNA